MADPVVSITNGVPTSGTGAITTLGQTLLDGAQVTQGAIADAAVTAGAAGTISAKLRSISRDIIANIVLAAGTAIIGKVGIDQTTPGTTNAVALSAETTKVIGVTRTADGSGNLLTSTASALDVNIKSGIAAVGATTESASSPVVHPTDMRALRTSQDTSTLLNGNTALTPVSVGITASASGVTTIVALVAAKKIRILALALTVNGAVNPKFQSHATTATATGLFYCAAAGDGIVLPYNPLGWFDTVAGEALDINLSGAVAVGGTITYVAV